RYETLSKRDRKQRHLRAAAGLESSGGYDPDEVVEVIASHYLEASQAMPDAEDAAEIRAKARDAFEAAGRRAESLAAHAEAERYYVLASELADESNQQARFLEAAGRVAYARARSDVAEELYGRALELLDASGDRHAAARIRAAIAQ